MNRTRLKHAFGLLIIFTIYANYSLAQTSDLGSWNIVNVKFTIDDKWSAFGEGQLRSLRFYDHFHYYEYKGGISYKIRENVALTMGAGSYQTYMEGGDFVLPKNNNEFRIWPQLILGQSLGRLKVEQRYRSEMRFTSNGYRNRFRYRVGLAYPFGKTRDGFKPFQINVNNELFFTDTQPYFERNRMSLGMNYKPSATTTLQMGYLHQFDYQINDETGRSFLQLGIFLELFSEKSKNSSGDMDPNDY